MPKKTKKKSCCIKKKSCRFSFSLELSLKSAGSVRLVTFFLKDAQVFLCSAEDLKEEFFPDQNYRKVRTCKVGQTVKWARLNRALTLKL